MHIFSRCKATIVVDENDTRRAELRRKVRRRFCGVFACLFVTERDDRRTVALKLFLTRLSVVLAGLVVFFLAFGSERVGESMWFFVTIVLAVIHVVLTLTGLFTDTINRALPIMMIIEALMVFSIDMGALVRVGRPRFWPIYCLVFAISTVFCVSRPVHLCVYMIAAVHMVMVMLHMTVQLDWLDPLHPSDWVPDLSNCDKPPCTDTVANSLFDVAVYVATLSFVSTILHGFAARVDEKNRRLVAAIEVAETVATNLSAFDLEATEELLAATTADAGHDLPPKLHAALTHILENLKLYRPYLPDELFQERHGYDDFGLVDIDDLEGVPGSIDGRAAVVFTDIRQSTALWEHSGEAMRDALAQHNITIRTAIAAWRGYEVKTIGDAFMIAFHTVGEAVRFGVEVQTAFARAEWPVGLTRPDADDGFALLTVRIGVHWGRVDVERNALTGRYDYFGPTVNAAARVEAHAIPGAVTTTPAVMEAGVSGDGFVAIPYAEARYGKGMGDALWLTALVGRELPEAVVAHVRGLCGARDSAPGPAGVASRGRLDQMRATIQSLQPDDENSLSVLSASQYDSQPSTAASFNRSLRTAATEVWSRHVCNAATVGVIKFAFAAEGKTWASTEDAIARRLQQLHVQLRATGGHLSLLLHNMALVSWGVYGQCPQYMNESVRFLLRLDEEFRDGPRSASGYGFHAGLATGAVSSGKVPASASQTLLTMLGPCVDVALALCGGAAEVGAAALVASLAEEDMDRYECNELLRSHLRGVDVWEAGAGRRGMTVYELRLRGLAVVAAGGRDVQQGPTEYERAYAARDAVALEVLGGQGDGVAMAVARNMRDGRHMAHKLVCWAGGQRLSLRTGSALGGDVEAVPL